MKTALKVILWSIMAIVLVIAATLICAVKILTPDRLTPIVERVANKTLAADVSLGRVALDFYPAFPTLRLSVDSACVVSKAFDALPPDSRNALPPYADTLLTFDRFAGAVALDRLISKGEIALRDVVLRGPAVNIVVASDSVYNFDLMASGTDDTDDSPTLIPPFSIDRFRLEDARAIRYFNAVDSTDATVVILADAGLDGTQAPAYRIRIDGAVNSPAVRSFTDIENISFGADGRVRWDPDAPQMIAFERFSLSGAFVKADVDAEIDFSKNLTVRSAAFALHPVAVDSLLCFVPADMRKKWHLARPYLATPATVAVKGALTRPFDLTVDTIPHAAIDLTVADAPLRYGQMRLENIALDLGITLRGNNPDSALVRLRRFEAAGPATRISAEASVSEILRDPRFDACLKLRSDIARLPSIVADLAGGYLSGTVDADVDIRGRQSMFEPRAFHRLEIEGRVDARNFYYLRNDTDMMAEVRKASFDFGSGRRFADDEGKLGERTLTASIRVDTANILSGGIGMGIADVVLGVGVENSGLKDDTTLVVPMGGILKVGRFNLSSVSDSAGMRLRGLEGRVSMTRFKGKYKFPRFSFDLIAQRISAGAPAARVMLREPHIVFEAHKLLSPRMPRSLRRLTDSIAAVHPELPPDSVYRLAIEKRRHRPGEKIRHRVHTELTAEETQMLEWGTSKALRRLLRTWDLQGRVTTRRARLFTPVFPLRNRITNVDIRFNTDSIILTDIRYKGGRSDLTVNGIVSNMRRGFTSSGYRSPLRANLAITSKAIDVNELAAATFAGAAYSDRMRKGTAEHIGLDNFDGNDDDLERRIAAATDSAATGPLLIPTNIDAQINVRADSIFYSDLTMSRFSGDLLMYNGALNLHNLRCASDIGSLTLDALYSAPGPDDMKFGFGLDAKDFDIRGFLKLVPAIDSIMPLMRDFGGTISADIAATCDVDTAMNLVLPSLDAAVRLQGDSLQFIDSDTYRTLGKWLGFKNKESNIVKHLDVEMTIKDDVMQIYPFMLDIDRYRLGVQGYNDLALNFNYHISVLKSPLPFKFGITVKGTPDDYKVRFGGSKFKADAPAASIAIVDTARVSLISQIQNIFRRGVSRSRFAVINTTAPARRPAIDFSAGTDTLSRADSLALIREGLLDAPAAPADDDNADDKKAPAKKSKSRKKKAEKEAAVLPSDKKNKK